MSAMDLRKCYVICSLYIEEQKNILHVYTTITYIDEVRKEEALSV